jgi:hypothetical protein
MPEGVVEKQLNLAAVWTFQEAEAVMNAKTSCPTAEVRCTTVGQMALLQGGSAAALPLLVGHSHISGPGGQRLVSVIQ